MEASTGSRSHATATVLGHTGIPLSMWQQEGSVRRIPGQRGEFVHVRPFEGPSLVAL
jgi:hypothetical protein